MEKLFEVPLKKNSMYLRKKGNTLSSDSYFGCFPAEAYLRHTRIRNVRAAAKVRGRGTICLCCLEKAKTGHRTGAEDTVLLEQHFDTAGAETFFLPLPLQEHPRGCFYIKVDREKGAELTGLWYEGEPAGSVSGGAENGTGGFRNFRIAVIICTFRREESVLRNLQMLQSTIDADPMLKQSMEVICVDNGGTLEDDKYHIPAGVRLVRNRNFGGSGGYARGMLEALGAEAENNGTAGRRHTFSHIWLMDDDISIEPSVLRRAMSFLKYRKQESLRLAAGMFSLEEPTVQQEATAVFNGCTFVSNASGLDFRDRNALLENKVIRQKDTYAGWWSYIAPVSQEMPMPFFIKLDDVEYELRAGRRYQSCPAVMNGFGVWHEAFGKKANAWTEYYTTRNTLIIQALYPDLLQSPVRTMAIRLVKALAYGEPKCMEAVYRGARDYAEGPETFRKEDPEERHRRIMTSFKAPLRQNMSRKMMPGCAAVRLLLPRNWKSVLLFLKSICLLKKAQAKTLSDPAVKKGWESMQTEKFWKEYLGLTGREKLKDQDHQKAQGYQEQAKPLPEELISVIIPVYNVAEYLDQCLESVCAQTYRNLEIILIDDGSTDGSGGLCDKWASRDKRIKVIHKENGGVSSARNEGLKAASGSLIGFVDSDDWIEPEMYEKLVRSLLDSDGKRSTDAAISGFFDYPYGMEKAIPRGTGRVDPCGFEEAVIQILSRDGYYCTLWNKLFRRTSILRNNEPIFFDRDISFGEDEVWLMQVLKNCGRVIFLPEPLYHWRKREGSATRFERITDRQLSLLEAKKRSFQLLPKKKAVRELAKSKMFNDCFFLKLQAYCTKDHGNYRLISRVLRPMERAWLISNDTPALRKAKVLVMDIEMTLGLPPVIIRFTDNIKKMHR